MTNHQNKKTNRGNDFTAKKSLGQNFLEAPHIVEKMISVVDLQSPIDTDTKPIILEVGPGKGILTEALLKTGARVVAVEKDDRAIGFLEEKFSGAISAGKLVLIHGDILEFDVEKAGLPCGKYIIAANIPYYITGELLRKFLESSCAPQKMVVMLQKEVAERIIGNTDGGKDGGGKESILSISVKVYGKPEYIMTVPAEFFNPKPKVDSALLSIDAISKDFFTKKTLRNPLSERKFFEIVKTGFAHKRKVVKKNLEKLLSKETLDLVWNTRSLSPKIRAEDLTVEDWRVIANEF